jgi:hypothetical protein
LWPDQWSDPVRFGRIPAILAKFGLARGNPVPAVDHCLIPAIGYQNLGLAVVDSSYQQTLMSGFTLKIFHVNLY